MSESRRDDNPGDLDPASAANLDATYSDELDFPGLPQVLWQMDRFDRTNTLEEQLKQVEDRLRFLDSMTSERRALESRLGAHLDLALDYQELESKGDEAALIYEKFALTDEQIQQLEQGVELRNEKGSFAATDVKRLAECELQMTVHQGVYHQVKRMLAAVGNKVESLHRQQIGALDLTGIPDLVEGHWIYLNAEQVALAKTRNDLESEGL